MSMKENVLAQISLMDTLIRENWTDGVQIQLDKLTETNSMLGKQLRAANKQIKQLETRVTELSSTIENAPAPAPALKPKRKRRTKAEMSASKAQAPPTTPTDEIPF